MDEKILVKSNQNLPPIERLVILAKSYYDTGEVISSDYLKWQYSQNPCGHPVYSLASCQDKIIGQYLIIPLKYRFNDENLNGSLSLNTLTHPDFQGRGLFTKLAESTYDLCAQNQIEFTIGFPNPLSYGGFVKKLDFTEIGQLNLLIKPIKPLRLFLDRLKPKKDKHGGDLPFKWTDVSIRENLKISSFNFDKPELYEDFWKNIKSEKIHLVKDFKFLKWRYQEIPGRKYHIIQATRNGKITSLCVLRIEKVLSSNSAVIMDLFCIEKHQNDCSSLIRSIVPQLKKQNINLISTLAPTNKEMYDILKKVGFIQVPNKLLPQQIPVIFKSHKNLKRKGFYEDISNWNISFGDYDIF